MPRDSTAPVAELIAILGVDGFLRAVAVGAATWSSSAEAVDVGGVLPFVMQPPSVQQAIMSTTDRHVYHPFHDRSGVA